MTNLSARSSSKDSFKITPSRVVDLKTQISVAIAHNHAFERVYSASSVYPVTSIDYHPFLDEFLKHIAYDYCIHSFDNAVLRIAFAPFVTDLPACIPFKILFDFIRHFLPITSPVKAKIFPDPTSTGSFEMTFPSLASFHAYYNSQPFSLIPKVHLIECAFEILENQPDLDILEKIDYNCPTDLLKLIK